MRGLFESKDKISNIADWEAKEVDQKEWLFPFFTKSDDVSEPLEVEDIPSFKSPQEDICINEDGNDGDYSAENELDNFNNIPKGKIDVSTAVSIALGVVTIGSSCTLLLDDW